MSTSVSGRPGAGEFAPYYERYLALVPGDDVLGVLAVQAREVERTLRGLSGEQAGFRYAEGKWSIREVVGHVIDGERVFAYRVLAFARGEQAPLPAFDENAYAQASAHDEVALAELLDEFATVRAATLHLLRHLPDNAWGRIGTASGKPVSVRALAFIIAGHAAHHLAILHERYGVPRPA